MKVTWGEKHRTNTPFKAWLSPWTNHGGHLWEPEVGAFAPCRTAAHRVVFMCHAALIQQQPKFPGLWAVWPQA